MSCLLNQAAGTCRFRINFIRVQVFSQRTGRLDALLLDDGVLTEMRTAAAGALAVRCLGPKRVGRIGLLGTGVQARYQLRFLRTVTDCREVLVFGRTESNVAAFVKECAADGWKIAVASRADELLEACGVIVCVTSSREALLGITHTDGAVTQLDGGQLIVCIGADAPGKMELNPRLVAAADLLVADSLLQTQERGEYKKAIEEGLVSLSDVVEIGKILGGRKDLQRRAANDDRLIIFDSSGVAVQDCAIAGIVYKAIMQGSQ